MSSTEHQTQSRSTSNNQNPAPKQYVRQSQMRIVFHHLSKNKGAMVGLFIILATFRYLSSLIIIYLPLAESLCSYQGYLWVVLWV